MKGYTTAGVFLCELFFVIAMRKDSMLERVYLMIANHLIKIVNHVLALYSGNLENFGNVQNEQFPRRHFYVPFGEFVHLHMYYYSFANSLLKHSAFQFFTPARKPPTTFYLESLLSR